jgi:hypothetical protein
VRKLPAYMTEILLVKGVKLNKQTNKTKESPGDRTHAREVTGLEVIDSNHSTRRCFRTEKRIQRKLQTLLNNLSHGIL